MNYKEISEKIDLSPLGLEPADDAIRYYCTPVDAHIFARAGVDGIHYVTIPAYGEIVFCVDPSGCHMPEVFPLAEDFDDLWKLLLTCGDMTNLVDADSVCDEVEFTTNVEAALMEEEVQSTLKRLAQVTGQKEIPIEDAYRALTIIKSGIDCSNIQYSDEYWELHGEVPTIPDRWEVYFHGSFWGHDGMEQPCEELPFHTEFDWAGKHWRVPAAYVSKEGLVLDLCMAVEAEEMLAFIDKWNGICEENDLWDQYEAEMQAENPLQLEFFPVPAVNGVECQGYGSCGIPWTPSLPEEERDDSPEADYVAEHYGLDPQRCWMIHRFSFPWGEGGRPREVESLSVRMTTEELRLPGGVLECHQGESVFQVQHPVTGTLHTLTVTDCHAESVDLPEMYDMDFPNQLYVLTCAMDPKPEPGSWYLQSVTQSDEPRSRWQTEADNSCSFGIIGGADGPTAILTEAPGRCFPSSLHFDLPEEMVWQLVWRWRLIEEKTFPFLK